MLVERKRLVLRLTVPDWVAQVEALPFLTLVPVDNRVALRTANLDTAFRTPIRRIV